MKCYTLTKSTKITTGITLYRSGDWWTTSDGEIRTCRHEPPHMYVGDTSGVADLILSASVVRLRVDDTVYHVLRPEDTADRRVMIQDDCSATGDVEVILGGYIRISRRIFIAMPGSVLKMGLLFLIFLENEKILVCDRSEVDYYLDSLKSGTATVI